MELDGLKPSVDKVKAAKDNRRPKTKETVRNFLGMTGYLSKFIPRYASITAPRRKLTQKQDFFSLGSKRTRKVREKSRECHNHKPQPFPDTERKRKPTNQSKHKLNKRTKKTKINSLSSPS